MSALHRFDAQLHRGESGERWLDDFFSLFYDITPASRDEQRKGIDRHFVSRWEGWDQIGETQRTEERARYAVEYKSDFLTHRTGNAFVETVSVDSEGKDGWLITSQADVLIYFVVYRQSIFISRVDRLRELAALWKAAYPSRWAQNAGYRTHGITVPLTQYARSAYKVIQL